MGSDAAPPIKNKNLSSDDKGNTHKHQSSGDVGSSDSESAGQRPDTDDDDDDDTTAPTDGETSDSNSNEGSPEDDGDVNHSYISYDVNQHLQHKCSKAMSKSVKNTLCVVLS